MRSLILLALVLLFFLLPVLTGYARIPTDPLTPEKLGHFIGEILAYWIAMFRGMVETIQHAVK
ncbi:MAG: hypothetical protein J7K36_03290 [Archaeoglobaceae archaeon]|nr:hypothetical protein [Archaeoglobaceae archaeon]